MSDLNMQTGTHNISFTITIASVGQGFTKEQLRYNVIDLESLERKDLPPAKDQSYGMTLSNEQAKQMGWKIKIETAPDVGLKYII